MTQTSKAKAKHLTRYKSPYGVQSGIYKLTIDDNGSACILGNDQDHPMPNMMPLDGAGKWLPALIGWRSFTAKEGNAAPTFTAGEVLAFLEPWQP